MSDVETLLHKLRSLAIDADRGVSRLEDKLEDLLKQLRDKYKQGKLSGDTVEEIISRKARIQDINRQIKAGKLKPKSKSNPKMRKDKLTSGFKPASKLTPQDDLTYCQMCGHKTVNVQNRRSGRKRRQRSVCSFCNGLNYLSG